MRVASVTGVYLSEVHVMHSLDSWSLVSSDNFAIVMTGSFVSPAVTLFLTCPRISLYYIHDPTCLDDCSEGLRIVFYLQTSMQLCNLPSCEYF